MEHGPLRAMFRNGGRTTLLIAIVCMSVLLTIALLFSYRLWAELNRFAPLGPYPVQTVHNPQPISIGEPINVEGIKCNQSAVPVDVTGVLSWQSIDPPGTIIEVGRGTSVRPPGCVTQRFENTWPEAVVELTERWVGEGRTVVWHIVGEEQPVAADGRRGDPITFQTENFEITGGDAP